MPADDILQVEGVASTSASDKEMHADEILHVEDGSVNYEPIKHENTGYEPDVTFGRKRPKTGLEKRLVWKQDLIIVPLLATVYLASFLDRNSLGNARIMGLQKNLGMTNRGYSDCAQMFFVGFIIALLPANIFLRVVPPNILIGGGVIGFGILVVAMSAAQNTATILALRILIGVFAGLCQGTGLYASFYYKRDEAATRASIYYSTSSLAGAFSGLIAYGVESNLTLRATGREPWRWLFIIDGSIALFFGVVLILFLPIFPDKMKHGKNWIFSTQEIDLAIQRSTTFNTIGSKLEWGQVWAALKDPKAWIYSFMNGGIALSLTSIGVFLPTFILDFGYTAVHAQLFSVIPYAFGVVTLPIACYISDRINRKGIILVLMLSLMAIGYIILLTVSSLVVKMVGTCFICAGLYATIVLNVTWLSINNNGFTKRGTVFAMSEIWGQCFAIMGAYIYTDAPRYVKGHSVVLSMILLSIVCAIALIFWMRRANKKRDKVLADYAARGEVHPHIGRSLEEVSDSHINYRYTL